MLWICVDFAFSFSKKIIFFVYLHKRKTEALYNLPLFCVFLLSLQIFGSLGIEICRIG